MSTVGKSLINSGRIELRSRRSGVVEEMTPDEMIPALLSKIAAETTDNTNDS